jgi:hypothetical protein
MVGKANSRVRVSSNVTMKKNLAKAIRQQKVFELLGKGRTEQEIAKECRVTKRTIARDKIELSDKFKEKLREFDAISVVEEAIRGIDVLMRDAWEDIQIFDRSPQARARNRELIKDLLKQRVDLMEKCGIIGQHQNFPSVFHQQNNQFSVYQTIMEHKKNLGELDQPVRVKT